MAEPQDLGMISRKTRFILRSVGVSQPQQPSDKGFVMCLGVFSSTIRGIARAPADNAMNNELDSLAFIALLKLSLKLF